MNVLHFAYVDNDPCSGVSVAVPKHILSQQQIESVAFVNVADLPVDGVKHQFPFQSGFCVSALPAPFCKPDIVIFHEVYRPPFLKIAKELRKAGIPYIIVPHGCLTRDAQHKKFLKKKLGNAVFFYDFIKHAVAIQCLSDQESVTTAYGKEHFIGVNGIEMPDACKTGFRENGVRLLYIGRLDPFHKGLDLLMQAIATTKELFVKLDVQLAIYGPDAEGQHAQIKALIEENAVGDVVTLHGPITGDDKRRALLDADLFIQTSRFEGMPMGVLEALSYGLPCLLTTGTCVGEQVAAANGGWSCDISASAIADMLRTALVERDSWSLRSEGARTFIKDGFELSAVAAQTLAQYQSYCR